MLCDQLGITKMNGSEDVPGSPHPPNCSIALLIGSTESILIACGGGPGDGTLSGDDVYEASGISHRVILNDLGSGARTPCDVRVGGGNETA